MPVAEDQTSSVVRMSTPTSDAGTADTAVPRTPRSLTDDLREREDAALAELLLLRPDLANPLPTDLRQLATRSVTATATARAIDKLDQYHVQVLETVAALSEPMTTEDVVEAVPDDAARVRAALDHLVAQALVWGPPEARRATASVKEVLGRFPAGLGPPLAELAPGAAVPDVLTHLDDVPPGPSDVLARLAWGPPHGSVDAADRAITMETARTPIEWLLARRLLVATDKKTVILPREVALQLRGGVVHESVTHEPPAEVSQSRETASIDRAAAGTAFEVTRQVEDLLEWWSVGPPSVLRSGGVGVRDLRAAAQRLNVDEATVALYLEVLFAGGLLAASGDVDDAWLPTPEYDRWRAKGTAAKWAVLGSTWLATTRVPGLVGGKGHKDSRINALAPELDRSIAPDLRQSTLRDLAQQPAGTVVTVTSLVERQAWRRPRRGTQLRDDLVRWTLAEASALGIAALGALSTFGRALIDGELDSAAESLAPLLPKPVTHVMIQADLTAVAPGPLDGDVAREFALVADVESAGGATVFRFTDSSIRRALDAGRSSIDVREFIGTHSSTTLPQPLTYLIDDVARRHGKVLVGAAGAYIRSEDVAILDEILAHRQTSSLRARRLAPTVIATQAPADAVLEHLRRIGLAPAAESADGAVVVRRPDSLRTGPRQAPPRLVADPPPPPPAVALAAVRALRAAERGSTRFDGTSGPAGENASPSAVNETIDVLLQAASDERSVWLGYVGSDGVSSERVVDPVEVRNGWLTAFDHRLEQVGKFAIHRITGVAALVE